LFALSFAAFPVASSNLRRGRWDAEDFPAGILLVNGESVVAGLRKIARNEIANHVADERAGQQAASVSLESRCDASTSPRCRELFHRLHHGTQMRDGAAAQIMHVAESPGTIEASISRGNFLVPEITRRNGRAGARLWMASWSQLLAGLETANSLFLVRNVKRVREFVQCITFHLSRYVFIPSPICILNNRVAKLCAASLQPCCARVCRAGGKVNPSILPNVDAVTLL